MISRPALAPLLARITAAVVVWGPIVLGLTALAPVASKGSAWPHVLAGTALAFIVSHALSVIFLLPVASDAPGRHRVVPSAPHRPMLVTAVGLGAMGWGVWALARSGGSLADIDFVALAALPAGALACWIGLHWARDALWGTWLEVSGDALRVHCPRAEGWSVPLGRIITLHVRPRDQSFVVEAPQPERDVFVPTRHSGARFYVTGAADLFARLAERAPIRETPLLSTTRHPRT